MRRRYYCDYCDKSFIDDLEARKKHLQSSYHIKLRNLYYENYRDPKTVLKEETQRSPCRRFFSNGTCQFAGICKYTHYTPDQLWEIKQQVDLKEQDKVIRIPTVESWLQKYYERHNKDSNLDVTQVPWSYSEQLEQRSDLPPSIKKMRPSYFHHSDFDEWGK